MVATLLPASSAAAQVVRGVVLEGTGATPVTGVALELRSILGGRPVEATSDSLGQFTLTAPRPGIYAITARRVGFAAAGPDTLTLARDEQVSIEIRLGISGVPLDPVLVTSRSDEWITDFERRRKGPFGQFVTRADIEARNPEHTSDLLRTLPGFVSPASRGRRGAASDVLMRGTVGLCQPAVWIDGVYTALGSGTVIDNVINPSMIEGVEVYNTVAAAPTQYRIGTCGVLLFWTRRGTGETGERFQWKKVLIGAGAAALLIFLVVR